MMSEEGRRDFYYQVFVVVFGSAKTDNGADTLSVRAGAAGGRVHPEDQRPACAHGADQVRELLSKGGPLSLGGQKRIASRRTVSRMKRGGMRMSTPVKSGTPTMRTLACIRRRCSMSVFFLGRLIACTHTLTRVCCDGTGLTLTRFFGARRCAKSTTATRTRSRRRCATTCRCLGSCRKTSTGWTSSSRTPSSCCAGGARRSPTSCC